MRTVLWAAAALTTAVVLVSGCRKAAEPVEGTGRDKVAPADSDSGTEYYCPMHPRVVRDNKEKCPICSMPLSERKKGEEDLPPPPGGTAEEEEAVIREIIGKLATPADRLVAAGQKYCPVTGERLGSMGVPVRLDVKGRPVFVCCKGCKEEAEADPDRAVKLADAFLAGKVPQKN